jgi:hypothetical protein
MRHAARQLPSWLIFDVRHRFQSHQMNMIRVNSFEEAQFLLRENRSFIVIGSAPVIFRSNYDKKSYLVIKEHEDGTYRAMECQRSDIKRIIKIVISSSPEFLDNIGSWREMSDKESDYAKYEILNHIPEAEDSDDEDEESDDEGESTEEAKNPSSVAEGALTAIASSESGEAVYILTNPSLPNLVKIGRTERSVEERASELSGTTGVPTPFEIFRAFHVSNSVELERIVHERLKSYRISSSREFFRIDPETACDLISSLIEVANKPIEDEIDGMLMFQARRICEVESSIWPGLIMSKLNITYDQANRVVAHLVESKIISPNGTPVRLMANSNEQF